MRWSRRLCRTKPGVIGKRFRTVFMEICFHTANCAGVSNEFSSYPCGKQPGICGMFAVPATVSFRFIVLAINNGLHNLRRKRRICQRGFFGKSLGDKTETPL
jgi:hypothetical protein